MVYSCGAVLLKEKHYSHLFQLLGIFSLTDVKRTRGRERGGRRRRWRRRRGEWRKMGLGKDGVARENNGSGETWQLETEVGRTLGDVLPYKSASVWCTAINLNDLSPPRACFGIQKPQRGLLACQGCSSFGLPPPPPLCGTALLIRTCGWGRDWLQHAHYLPLSSGLDSDPSPSEPTRHHTGAKTKTPIRQPGC